MSVAGSTSAAELASAFAAEQRALAVHNTGSERLICRKYSKLVSQAPAEYVLAFARLLIFTHRHRWQAYELIAGHKAAFQSLGTDELEEFGQGINSWWSVDAFGRPPAGPGRRGGVGPAALRAQWASSPD